MDDRELRCKALQAAMDIRGAHDKIADVLKYAERIYAFLLSGRPTVGEV